MDPDSALVDLLEERVRLLTRFADAHEDLVFIKDADGRYLMVNEANAAFFGRGKDDILARTDFDLMPAEAAARCRQTDLEAMTGEGVSIAEESVDGRVYETRKFLVDLGDDRPAVAGLIRDVTEHRRAAEALAESERRFRALFLEAPLAYQALDGEGRLLDVNRAWCGLLGYTRDEVLGRRVAELLAPDETDRFEDLFAHLRQSGQVRAEFLMRRKDGHLRLIGLDGRTGQYADGRFRQTHCILTDITERRAAEDELTLSEQRFRSLFEHSVNALALHQMVFDDEGKPVDYVFVATNPEFTLMTGLEAPDVIGRRVTEVLPGIRESGLIERYGRVVASGTPDRFRTFVEPLERHYDIAVFSPAPGIFATAFSDVTDEVAAAERLRTSEEKFRLAMDAARLGIYDWDVPSGSVYYSPGYAAMLGSSAGGIQPPLQHRYDEWERRLHGEDRRVVLSDLQALLDGRNERFEVEYRLRTDDGRWIWVLEQARVVERDPEGGARRAVGTISDITARRRVQEDLQSTGERLRRIVEGAVAALGAVVESKDPYTAGHERRVAELACAIGAELGMDEAAIDGLRLAAMMHDLGKIAVPAEILSKPGVLTDTEMQLVRRHAQVGYDIIAGIEFDQPVAAVVWQHHERLDGSGYPRGLAGEDILPEARVLAVADVVEAMVSHRPYRPARSIAEALGEIADGAGTIYDPAACTACLRLFSEMGFVFSS
jgi:PAS domain S-box-containing protein